MREWIELVIDKTKIGGITMQSVRIYEMPACKMVSSGTGMFGKGKFNLRDTSRSELGNIITSPYAKEIMGYEQMYYYIPIRKDLWFC